ncbi:MULTISPECIES: hypothetical protein [unclassified Prochlorococcus]|uniref:hypothetical protein n=1 Tax=unclassified Prochlorococcus TaxID=2627481 RepID=UPI001F4D0E78|nr:MULTISPECIES: hypothetical protein [unclassified Prochlorococcus]
MGISIAQTSLLVLMLALGSQNLSERHSVNLGISSTEKLPSGFLIGISIALGSLTGGLATTFLMPLKQSRY